MCPKRIPCVFFFCGLAWGRRRQEGPFRYKLTSAKPSLEKGKCKNGNLTVVCTGTGKRGPPILIRNKGGIPSFLLTPGHARHVLVSLQRKGVPMDLSPILLGFIGLVVYKTAKAICALSPGESTPPSSGLSRQFSDNTEPPRSYCNDTPRSACPKDDQSLDGTAGAHQKRQERRLDGWHRDRPLRNAHRYTGDARLHHPPEGGTRQGVGQDTVIALPTQPTLGTDRCIASLLWGSCLTHIGIPTFPFSYAAPFLQPHEGGVLRASAKSAAT